MNIISYRPGFAKLIHHLDHLKKMEKNKDIVSPIHVSFFPNNFCNLDCDYCCFGKTKRTNEELSLGDFYKAIDILSKYDLKAVEISGGGEPLLWSNFIPSVEYAYSKGLKLSLVTNGLLLETIPKDVLAKFSWIRVSIQSTKYAENINMNWIPDIVKKSMSFIVPDNKRLFELEKLYSFAKEKNIIVRVAPHRPCNLLWENTIVSEVDKYGYPLISFKKEIGSPLGCYMVWIRAAIDWKGNFLPCPSIELSNEYAGKIPDNFALCHVSELDNWLKENRVRDLGYRCSYCNCGFDTNNFIHTLMQKVEDVDFV